MDKMAQTPIDYFEMVNNASDLIQQLTPNGRFRYVNRRWLNVMGYAADEVIGLPFERVLPEHRVPYSQRMLEDVAKGYAVEQVETIFVTKNDEEIAVEGNLNGQFDATGALVSIWGVFRNITRRKMMENALQSSLLKAQTLYHVADALISSTSLPDLMQTITERVAEALPADRVLLHIFNMEQEKVTHFVTGGPGSHDVIRYSFDALMNSLNGWVMQRLEPALASKHLQADDRVSREIVRLRERLDCGAIIVTPLHYRGQTLGTLTAINRPYEPDFSEKDVDLMMAIGNQVAIAIENARLYETQQQRSVELQTRNEELDSFARTVAHDLKAPLSAMIAYAEVSEEMMEANRLKKIGTYLGKIQQNGRKMSNIIDELMLLSQVRRAQAVRITPLDMKRIIEEAFKRLSYVIERYDAHIHIPTEWPQAIGYSPWVEEVWVNYISNALKYGGNPPHVRLGGEVQNGNMVQFWVQDDGNGVPAEASTTIFIPFERLDQADLEGHGLGLSIVKRIIDKLGGEVGYKSRIGQGSTFYFTLPATV